MSEMGKIAQVIGAVVDVSFEGKLPEIYTALRLTNPADNTAGGGESFRLLLTRVLINAEPTRI